VKITYYTIIGRDSLLLKDHLDNVKKYAGFDQLNVDSEVLVVIYWNDSIPQAVTNRIVSMCEYMNVRYVVHQEKTSNFLVNLYDCWNLGYQESQGEWVIRGGSDQVFDRDGFLYLYNVIEELESKYSKLVLQAQTIENRCMIEQIGAISRHFTEDFGNTFQEFKWDEFEKMCRFMNLGISQEYLTIDECLGYWGHPTSLDTTLGRINRTDGCSWAMKKKDWEKYGPLPVLEKGITGDVVIHDRLQRAGYVNFLVRDWVTYHFVRGESRGIVQ